MSRPKLLLMDEPSMGLAPILVERSFEIIKEVHESGVAILIVEQNANVSLSIADRGLRPARPGGSSSREGGANCSRTRSSGRHTWAVDAASTCTSCRRDPAPVSDLRAAGLHQLVLAGRLSDAVRGVVRAYLARLGREGAPWEYWVERTEAARAAFAGLINAEPDEVAVTTSLSAGVARSRADCASRGRAQGRAHRLGVPDDRPDLARAGVTRRARRPRAEADGRTIPRSASSADRRRHALVSITHVCYRNGAMLDVEPSRASSRTSAARSCCSTRTSRSARCRST